MQLRAYEFTAVRQVVLPIIKKHSGGKGTRMSTRLLQTSIIVVLLSFFSSIAFASPMKPELYERLKQENRLNKVIERLEDARARGYFHIEKPAMAKPPVSPSAGDIDTVRVPVILVDFSDNQYTSYSAAPEAEAFDSVLFSWGKVPTGSMSEYYWENSYGKFYLMGDVFGWYRMPQTYAYYVNGNNGFGGCPRCARQMVEDAINAANPDINYALYDNDGDNWMDGVFVVFAGYGAEETGSDNDIWSHRSSVGPLFRDGVYISDYSVEPEVRWPGVITDIGVFCHEYGHVLGLPDLYDTDYSSSGVGRWSMMSGGSWNGGGHTPAHFDAWCKKELGFIDPINVTINTENAEIPRAEDSAVVYRVWTQGQVSSQYFLIENRQRVLFDAALPGSGLLIWHIDETRSGNWDENHPLVAVEQADGLFELQAGGSSDVGDPWPGSSNNRAFTDFSTPNAHNYAGATTGIGVIDISNSDSLMTATLEIVFGRPFLVRDGFTFGDNLGNGDGRADPGENDVEMAISLHNLGADALGLTMYAETADPEIVFSKSSGSLGDVLLGQSGSNSADPVIFSVDPEFPPTVVDFVLTFISNADADTVVDTLSVDVGPPQIILVDDDESNPGDYEKYLLGIIDSLRMPRTVWGKDTLSSPPGDTLVDYPYVIWFTGDSRSEVLSSADVANLASFLDAGGRLFLTGQDIAQDLANDADSTFLRDYLYVRYLPGAGLPVVLGIDGDPISDGHFVEVSGTGGAANQNSPDKLVPVSGVAKPVYHYYGGSDVAAVRVAVDDYRVVYFGFGFEGITTQYTTREEVYDRVFAWLNDEGPAYIPGDLDGDEAVNPVDMVFMVNYVYKDSDPPPILNAADVNADCQINPVDIVYLVNYVYKSQGTLLPGCAE